MCKIICTFTILYKHSKNKKFINLLVLYYHVLQRLCIKKNILTIKKNAFLHFCIIFLKE